MLKVGDMAPDFRLIGTSGHAVTLKGLRGRRVVLYFYPRDDTPGCTREACDFRDNLARLRKADAEVYGVSKDSLASHQRFRGKYDLPFELLSDPDNAVARAYGAYGTKTMYGKKVLGTIRSTFLIDARGRVSAVWSPVKVDGHVEAVLAALGGAAPLGAPAAAGERAKRTTARKKAVPGKAARKAAARKPAARKAARKSGPKAIRRPARKA